jgi:hypothetical protein
MKRLFRNIDVADIETAITEQEFRSENAGQYKEQNHNK